MECLIWNNYKGKNWILTRNLLVKNFKLKVEKYVDLGYLWREKTDQKRKLETKITDSKIREDKAKKIRDSTWKKLLLAGKIFAEIKVIC